MLDILRQLFFRIGVLSLGRHNTQYNTLSTIHSVQYTQYKTLSTRHSVQDTQYKTLSTRHSVLGTQYKILSTRHSVQDTQYETLSTMKFSESAHSVSSAVILSVMASSVEFRCLQPHLTYFPVFFEVSQVRQELIFHLCGQVSIFDSQSFFLLLNVDNVTS